MTASLSGSSYDGTEMIDYLTRNQEKLVVVDGEKTLCRLRLRKGSEYRPIGGRLRRRGFGNPKVKRFQKAIESRLPQKFVTMNLKALELGAQEVK